ncbi:MAG TPA: glycosyltransferase family 39 protein [Syntrophorhabdaceae bacterium]|nr:glycosyltransferase family 39 protein [Syntrophorhabdaceae bacterium]HQM81407.1 glycosyltransferase family 39 protein [Syntrophorhabdaceae bacterium]
MLPSDRSGAWTSRDWFMLLILIIMGCALLFPGLSVRSLWGSEGRWAVVAREMIRSGNYFLPTINGEVYFDKPLFSYWAIIPFALKGGVTEAAARMPGVLSGIMAVILIFVMGRAFFGSVAGFLAGTTLLTSFMFVYWARTASGEMLNLLGIWCMLWIFLSGGHAGRQWHLVMLYCTGALVAFCKGPVGPAVAFSVMISGCACNVLAEMKREGLAGDRVRKGIQREFRWILSRQGVLGACAGAVLFAFILFLPVIMTGSWDSLLLMWRENFLRFVRPFDHIEPPYVYVKHTLVFFLPWTLLLVAAIWQMHGKGYDPRYRWAIMSAAAIFLFFTASGSRRSYYILPLVPALALITGRALSQWFEDNGLARKRVMQAAAAITGAIPVLGGAAMIYSYFQGDMPVNISQLIVGPAAFAGGIAALMWLWKGKFRSGMGLLLALIWCIEIWTFTVGMAIAEEKRTLRPFCAAVAKELREVDDGGIAFFKVRNSSLVFYLDRPGHLKNLDSAESAKIFFRDHPGSFIITDGIFLEELQKGLEPARVSVVRIEDKDRERNKENNLVLVALARP